MQSQEDAKKRWPRFDQNGNPLACRVESCDNKVYRNGMCHKHRRESRSGLPLSEGSTKAKKWYDEMGNRLKCFEADCTRPVETMNLCNYHYQHQRYEQTRGAEKTQKRGPYFQDAKKCGFEACLLDATAAKGYCPGHYEQHRKGQELRELRLMIPCPVGWCVNSMKYGATMCAKHNALARKYGLDRRRMIDLFANGKCSNVECDSTEYLCIDHDHSCCPGDQSCGKCVRGLLCRGCNTTLGHVQENPQKLRGLILYLESSSG